MRKRAEFRKAIYLALTAAVALTALHPSAGRAAGTNEDQSCTRYALHLRLEPNEPTDHLVAGWLCALGAYDGQTVILASPSGLSSHAYWDWPQEKDTYSFVRSLTPEGYAVFNYDRIGTGESDRPPAAIVTVQSEAFLQDQLVMLLRNGGIGGIRFGKVVLAGNSLSTLIDIFQAEAYPNVDGLINTGIVVGASPVGLASLFTAFYPAQLDPKFAGNADIPLGYATTLPGSRAQFFYTPAADPATIALDEELKETATVGEASTFGMGLALTRLVDVPVLSLIGDHDILACVTVCQPGGVEDTKEHLFWSPATCLELNILPDAGHFVQLQPNSASASNALVRDWLNRRIGHSPSAPATQPCDATRAGP
jgi:pimeloyl-ACP methyl ester carboxylesterase